MKNIIFIGLLLMLGLSACKKSSPVKPDTNKSFPFNNEFIQLEIASATMPENIRDIHFFNEASGIAMSYDGKVYKTTDKGATWSLKFTNTNPEQRLHKIIFKDQNTGYIAGGNSGCSGTGCTPVGAIVIKTIDGGDTWNQIYQSPGAVDCKSLAINSDGDLFLIKNDFTPNSIAKTIILKSTDEGISWSHTSTVFNGSITKISFKNDVGYLIGGTGDATIIRSLDNGSTWTATKSFAGNWVGDISFSDNAAYCIVDGITLLKSINNGDTWQVAYQNANYPSNIITALSDKSCLLWGTGDYTGDCWGYSYGAFRQSVDSGNNWTETQLKEIGHINTASFYSSTEGYILSGKLIKVKTNPL